MKLEDVQEALARSPTILGIDREIEIIEQLRRVPAGEIMATWDTFVEIMDRLSISHSDDYVSVNDSNRAHFTEFAGWLRRLMRDVDHNWAAYLSGIADDFPGPVRK